MRAKCAAILVNAACTMEELSFVSKQASVMVQIVHIHFETPRADALNERPAERIPFLRNQLERTFNAEALIDVHEGRTEITALDGFHIVSDRHATGKPLRPKPDERHFLPVVSLHTET